VRNNWQARVSADEAHRRAAGRRKYNAVRQFRARVRRQEVLRLLGAFGWGYGVQARIAAALGVHPATISRDLAKLLPLVEECPACGGLRPLAWWDEG
jgi:hypothetical protein